MRRLLAVVLLAVVIASPQARAAEQVDLLLVLASDVSRSVDSAKFELQRRGYAAAIADHRVLEAVQSGPRHRIGVMFLEWSGFTSKHVVTDWTIIDGPAAAQAFAGKLLETPRSFADRTSISAGIDFAVGQLKRAPFTSDRRTIDVSGDGTNNSGRDVHAARDEAIALGININGLVILSEHPLPWNPEHTDPPGGLANYYSNNVTGGAGSFVMVAKDFDSFGDAIIKKMVAEIAFAAPASDVYLLR